MGEAEDNQTEAQNLSGGQEAHRGSAESKVGEGEAGSVSLNSVFALRDSPDYFTRRLDLIMM